jgi:hypothetical protein
LDIMKYLIGASVTDESGFIEWTKDRRAISNLMYGLSRNDYAEMLEWVVTHMNRDVYHEIFYSMEHPNLEFGYPTAERLFERACIMGHIKMIKYLAPMLPDISINPYLSNAIIRGRLNVVDYLCEKYQHKPIEPTTLFAIVMRGHDAILYRLLRDNMDPKLLAQSLRYATQRQNVSMVRHLLSVGADIAEFTYDIDFNWIFQRGFIDVLNCLICGDTANYFDSMTITPRTILIKRIKYNKWPRY